MDIIFGCVFISVSTLIIVRFAELCDCCHRVNGALGVVEGEDDSLPIDDTGESRDSSDDVGDESDFGGLECPSQRIELCWVTEMG
jgi:hypothetical protein